MTSTTWILVAALVAFLWFSQGGGGGAAASRSSGEPFTAGGEPVFYGSGGGSPTYVPPATTTIVTPPPTVAVGVRPESTYDAAPPSPTVEVIQRIKARPPADSAPVGRYPTLDPNPQFNGPVSITGGGGTTRTAPPVSQPPPPPSPPPPVATISQNVHQQLLGGFTGGFAAPSVKGFGGLGGSSRLTIAALPGSPPPPAAPAPIGIGRPRASPGVFS